ncbi:MAG: YbjN domain-containing protein [Gemmatimonadota bacterium]|nr:YbjN domain-containing protein [Gemmatimonadota bacterium]
MRAAVHVVDDNQCTKGVPMLTKEDIESFLIRLSATGATYSEVEPGFWIVRPNPESDLSLAVNYSPPVVLLRIDVMTLPDDATHTATLTRRLLELNASELLHGAYGIQNEQIVLTEALELSALDFEEFLASYESMTLALASHLRELGSFREAR